MSEQDWTRETAEAHVRSQGFRCRPIRPEERVVLLKLHAAGVTAEQEGATADELEGLALARQQVEAGIARRCGADLTAIIAGAPFDGQVHEAACPRCGNRFDWRAPWFPGVDGIGPDGPQAS